MIDKIYKIIAPTVKIPLLYPKNLEELSKKYNSKRKFNDFKVKFEFPPKTMDEVFKLFFNNNFEKLIFFDIVRLLTYIEQDKDVKDKSLFIISLQKLYQTTQNHIKVIILTFIARILINGKNSYVNVINKNLEIIEFKFLKICIDKQYEKISDIINKQSLKKVLKHFGLDKVLSDIPQEYSLYLIDSLKSKTLKIDNDKLHYKNNLLEYKSLENFYIQIEKIIDYIESKENTDNNHFLEQFISYKLGSIEDLNSNWYKLTVPEYIIERYKRLKGFFEFYRFVNIANYLTNNENIYFDFDTNYSDSKRLLNRAIFWSNYDEKFSSVKIWVNEEDYEYMYKDKPVNLENIEILTGIHNEACLLEFEEEGVVILEFFRRKDKNIYFESLIFINKFQAIKELLDNNRFDIDLYYSLISLADYKIKHKFLWQFWVERFLKNYNVFPNTSVLTTEKFKLGNNYYSSYTLDKGLKSSQDKIIEENIQLKDIIITI